MVTEKWCYPQQTTAKWLEAILRLFVGDVLAVRSMISIDVF